MADLRRRPELAESADRFRRAVESVGSHAEIASRIGISRSTIMRYITGRTKPSLGVVEKLAVVAHADFRWLLTGEGPATPIATPDPPLGDAAPAPAGDPRLTWLESERDVAMRAMLDAARRVESFTEAINALKAVAK